MAKLKPLDYLNLARIWLRTYPGQRRIWGDDGRRVDGIKVNYGFDRVPGADEQVFGGLVKLQDLSRAFTQTSHAPNILYLVSSALPYFPVQLAKMARKAGARIVLNQNGVAYPGWYGDGYQRENKSVACLHSIADHVFYQSEFCQMSAEKFLGERKPDQNSEILYNPVDTAVFRPDMGRRSEGNITMLLSGSHWTAYRVFAAIETLKIVSGSRSGVRLRIAGRFCWREEPKAAEKEVFDYAAKAGVGEMVEYTGPYSQQEAPVLMNSCTILLHTKYNDPCPRLVVEAMACGLPVIYSATGGVQELVGAEAGIGVPGPLDWEKDHPPAPTELGSSVLRVIENLDRFVDAARKRAVEKFDVQDWIERHRVVFSELTEQG